MTLNRNTPVIDRETLDRLEARLRRGIPAWERTHFIEQVVPLLVERLKDYLPTDTTSQT